MYSNRDKKRHQKKMFKTLNIHEIAVFPLGNMIWFCLRFVLVLWGDCGDNNKTFLVIFLNKYFSFKLIFDNLLAGRVSQKIFGYCR